VLLPFAGSVQLQVPASGQPAHIPGPAEVPSGQTHCPVVPLQVPQKPVQSMQIALLIPQSWSPGLYSQTQPLAVMS